jgi:hypothetical protein
MDLLILRHFVTSSLLGPNIFFSIKFSVYNYWEVLGRLDFKNCLNLPWHFGILEPTMPGGISFFKLIMSQWFLKKGDRYVLI